MSPFTVEERAIPVTLLPDILPSVSLGVSIDVTHRISRTAAFAAVLASTPGDGLRPVRRRLERSGRGAAIGEVVLATGMATVVTGSRSPWSPAIAPAAFACARPGRRLAERVTSLPGWASLPLGIGGGALQIALFGMYWDISLHIDQGRDPGPLANPAHYLILVGLFGIFFAGVVAIALPAREDAPGRRCGSPTTGTRRWAAS